MSLMTRITNLFSWDSDLWLYLSRLFIVSMIFLVSIIIGPWRGVAWQRTDKTVEEETRQEKRSRHFISIAFHSRVTVNVSDGKRERALVLFCFPFTCPHFSSLVLSSLLATNSPHPPLYSPLIPFHSVSFCNPTQYLGNRNSESWL